MYVGSQLQRVGREGEREREREGGRDGEREGGREGKKGGRIGQKYIHVSTCRWVGR